MKNQLKTYKVTFWRGNWQLRNGGYEVIKVMRGIDEEHVWKRAYKRDCCYGSMTPTNVEEVKPGEVIKEGRVERKEEN